MPGLTQATKSSVAASKGSYEELTIGLYAHGLLVGDRSSGLLCPFCHGGATREKSFSVTMYMDGVAYRCWRNSCGSKGKLSSRMGLVPYRDTAPAQTASVAHLYKTQPLSKSWREALQMRYNIVPDYATGKGWQSNSLDNLVIPLRGPGKPEVVGHEFRKIEGFPKSRIHFLLKDQYPRNAFETKGDKDTVLILEDNISALKASQVCRTYSLMGTNFTQDHVDELRREWPAKRYLLALDKDASEKASKYCQRYRLFLPELRLCPLQLDAKYMYVSEIETLVTMYKDKPEQ